MTYVVGASLKQKYVCMKFGTEVACSYIFHANEILFIPQMYISVFIYYTAQQ